MAIFLEILLICSLFSISVAQNCKNDAGESVDWFFAYKPPAQKNQKNMFLRKGIGYIYITSTQSSDNWKMSRKSINDSHSFIGETLSPIYKSSSRKDLFYILYNDEPPITPGSTIYGHAKGVVMTDGKTGLWMIHSSPKFPIEPVTVTDSKSATKNSTKKNNYFFPSTATRFGQSFLCLTLPVSEMNKIGVNLQYIRPKIYSYNVPKTLEADIHSLKEVITNKYVKKFPWSHKTELNTLGGQTFVSYAKSKDFDKDLYSDWLAPDIQSDLLVETWSNGPNELPSNCKSKYHVMDVKDVKIKTSDNYTLEFRNSQDHSKWAVSVNSTSSIVCVGDINRMLAQFKRGGGTVCYKNNFVWNKYMKAVADIQPCPILGGKPKIHTGTNGQLGFHSGTLQGKINNKNISTLPR